MKHLEKRKEFRELLEKKQKNKKEEEEEELKKLKREADVWKYINRKRDKKTWKENSIKKEEWRKYFKELLDGIEADETIAQQGTGKNIMLEEEEENVKEKEVNIGDIAANREENKEKEWKENKKKKIKKQIMKKGKKKN